MVLVDRYFPQDFWTLGALPLGVALDLVVGDPRGWPHPVRAIGRLIGVAERGLRVAVVQAGSGAKTERLAGVVLTVVVVGLVASLAWLATDLLSQLGGPATLIGRGLMIYWGLAIRSLGRETLRASEASSLFVARRELSMIVGRDTANLDATGINRACVETIGENTNDAIVAPLFWLAVLGPAGLWGYKAINTLDSMVGYRNARYRNFGWASARLDDLANRVPARLTWLLIAISAALLNEDGLASLRVGWRDGRKHPSPNAAWGEAAIAGALGVQLGGPASYGGLPTMKPLLGDPVEPIDRATVRRAVRIMLVAALHAVALSLAASIIFFGT
jgi:adenosylcobinamide-phosphate synthase